MPLYFLPGNGLPGPLQGGIGCDRAIPNLRRDKTCESQLGHRLAAREKTVACQEA